MPQFDFFSFSTQVFWSLATFFAFYFVFTQLYLPRVAEVLKLREKRKSLRESSKNITLFSLLLLYII